MFTAFTQRLVAALALGSFLASAAPTHAVQMLNQTVDVYDVTDGDLIAGSGIPINGFVQDNVLPVQSVSVAVKPRDRDTGQANQIVGDHYFVDPGQATSNPARPNLAFDFQFDPGLDGLTNYQLRLSLDFNPAAGNSAPGDFTVVQLPIFGGGGPLDGWNDTDGFFTTKDRPWNDDNVSYVVINTTNHTFLPGSVNFPAYNSNLPGEYEIRLEALDASGMIVLAGATAFAQVVPEPASLALAGVGLAGAAAVARRRRRQQA
jgi:hypothetical protein